jgi:hypothetical protein
MNNWDNTESYTASSEKKKLRMEELENADAELVEWKNRLQELNRSSNLKRIEMNGMTRARNYYEYYREPAYRTLYEEINKLENESYTIRHRIMVRRADIEEKMKKPSGATVATVAATADEAALAAP